jgi:hypothetical protein
LASNALSFGVGNTANMTHGPANVLNMNAGVGGCHRFFVAGTQIANVIPTGIRTGDTLLASNALSFGVGNTANMTHGPANVLTLNAGVGGYHRFAVAGTEIANVNSTGVDVGDSLLASNALSFGALNTANVTHGPANVINLNAGFGGYHRMYINGTQVGNVTATTHEINTDVVISTGRVNLDSQKTYKIESNASSIRHSVPPGSSHKFMVNTTEIMNVATTGITMLANSMNVVVGPTDTGTHANKLCLGSWGGFDYTSDTLLYGTYGMGISTTSSYLRFNTAESYMFTANNSAMASMTFDTCLLASGATSATKTGKLYLNQSGFSNSFSYSLQLQYDSAAKPTTSAWVVSSDQRVKANIQLANLDECWRVVETLPLKRFEWMDPIKDLTGDQKMLGWIAQDVKSFLPKSVLIHDEYGIPDFHALNPDQLDKMMYGALQKAMAEITALKTAVADLQARVATLGG